jgi:hypothetical protein
VAAYRPAVQSETHLVVAAAVSISQVVSLVDRKPFEAVEHDELPVGELGNDRELR